MAETPEDRREYKGPGKFTSAIGRGAVEGGILAAAALGVAALFSKNVRGAFRNASQLKKLQMAARTEEGVESLTAAHKLEQEMLSNPDHIKGENAAVMSILGGAGVGGLHGIYRGTKNAGAAQRQVDELNERVDANAVASVTEKRFTDALTAEREKAVAANPSPAK
jgi:hypothetical protein